MVLPRFETRSIKLWGLQMTQHQENPQYKHSGLIVRFPREREDWRDAFHSIEDFENAPPISFAIDGFLQNDAATLIAGLSGHGKTLVMLSLVKALFAGKGTKLWGQFDVLETAFRVVYLIPDCTITPFYYRLKLFHLRRYVRDGRLLVHTLSKGPTPNLSDPNILSAAKGAHVFLDTAVRFRTGNENDATANQELANSIFGLLRRGARTVMGAQHSAKKFAEENYMTLENVVRGSGDIGAMVSTAWGIKQLDAKQNILHIENIKPRDFEPPPPFQLIGRPYIDRDGDFQMHKRPGVCGSLADEQKGNKGGASKEDRERRAANKQLLLKLLQKDPDAKSKTLVKRFKEAGIDIKQSTIRRYRSEIRNEAPLRTVTRSA
jgi:hypothetical protein